MAVYVGRTTSSPPSGVSSSPRSSARSSSGTTSIASGGKPAVLAAQSHLRRPLARDDDPVEPREERLPVDVPDPGDVPAVGDPVVQRHHGELRRAAGDERPNRLVRPGGVLDEQHEQAAPADRDALEAPEGARRTARGPPGRRRALRRARARATRRPERCRRCRARGRRGEHGARRPERQSVKSTPSSPRSSTSRAPRRRAAAGHARRRGSGSPRGGPRRRPRTRTDGRSERHHFESAACWSSGRA